jgi:hypothetical protein
MGSNNTNSYLNIHNDVFARGLDPEVRFDPEDENYIVNLDSGRTLPSPVANLFLDSHTATCLYKNLGEALEKGKEYRKSK